MLILAGVSINAVVGDNGILSKAQDSVYLQSIAELQEFLQMEYSNYALEDNPYGTAYGLLKAKHPGWFYQNAQGYILDSEGHVLYLIKKSGLPEEIQKQVKGGDASKVSQYYKQKDVYGVTSDLQVYYCQNGTSTIMGLTTEDLDKDNPLEIAYDEDSLLAKVINGVGEDGKATEALSTQDLKSIKTLTIDTTEKLALLQEFKKLPSLQTVYFSNLTVPTLEGMQYATNITEVRFTSCAVQDYSALCSLSKLNKLYLIKPAGKNTDVATLCSSDKGIATAEFSNLKYFGIVGDGTYIQSTSKDYNGTRYDITDISGLANLSTTTKQAIQYMYLQNLQLTSIASISDYINITILRLEENALTTFNGIQNMSQLTYLIAPTCYSNTTSTYTIGKEETDTQNASTDALSYIYKNEEGKNTSLYYLDIRNAQNLKWTSYLSSCSGIRYLYMDNNTAIKDVSTIASTIGNCGVNYTIPSNMTISIIASNSVRLDLKNQTVSKTDFEKIKGNDKLSRLSLYNIKIKDGENLLSGTELNAEINNVLKTCTSLEYLQLANISDLTTIEFVKPVYNNGKVIQGTPNLKELDLRGTAVQTNAGNKNLNGLELLNDLITYNDKGEVTKALKQLSVSNNNIDFSYIQLVVSNLNGGTYWFENGWVGGLYCSSWTALKTLEKCSDMTYLYFGWHNACPFWYDENKVLDLSKCTSLKSWVYTKFVNKAILPSSLLSLSTTYSCYSLPDVSGCSSLTYINCVEDYTGLAQSVYDQFFLDLAGCTSLETLNLQRCNISDFSKIRNSLNTMTALKTLYVGAAYTYSGHESFHTIKDLSDLEGAISLTTLSITYSEKLTNIDFVSKLTNLETLTVTNTSVKKIPDLVDLTKLISLNLSGNKIIDITEIGNAPSIKYLYLQNNAITNIKPLENLKKLETLNLQNNALYDTSYTNEGNPYYTLTVFADLNQKQDGSLKELYLSGNNIEDFSMLQDSNLKWNAKSGW